jgi:A/G-specific adenine glycosylase
MALQGAAGKRGIGRRRQPASTAATALAEPGGIARPLLAWYRRTKRDLPWRESPDPYRVWVSEIMLQQTQVERVKEFFTRFLARFPTVHSLARAPEQEVLRLWEGLGYYRRARQLHAAAKQIVAEHGGEFPGTAAGLQSLPGIGRYTAGAIASIAFGAREPILEANSRRVFARLVGHAQPVGGSGDEPLWQVAETLVPARDPGLFNQAVMDLGAILCTPTRPLCDRCPLATACMAHQTGRTAEIPVATPRRATKLVRETAVVIRHGDRVVVERRPAGAWWEGLWDFPLAAAGERTTLGDRRLGPISYTVTHHRITRQVIERRVSRAPSLGRGRRLVAIAKLDGLAMTAPGRRIARLLAKDH